MLHVLVAFHFVKVKCWIVRDTLGFDVHNEESKKVNKTSNFTSATFTLFSKFHQNYVHNNWRPTWGLLKQQSFLTPQIALKKERLTVLFTKEGKFCKVILTKFQSFQEFLVR